MKHDRCIICGRLAQHGMGGDEPYCSGHVHLGGDQAILDALGDGRCVSIERIRRRLSRMGWYVLMLRPTLDRLRNDGFVYRVPPPLGYVQPRCAHKSMTFWRAA